MCVRSFLSLPTHLDPAPQKIDMCLHHQLHASKVCVRAVHRKRPGGPVALLLEEPSENERTTSCSTNNMSQRAHMHSKWMILCGHRFQRELMGLRG